MLAETHPLIDSIAKPLSDNAEMKLSAVLILEQTFDPDHPSVPQAMLQLEARDKRKFTIFGKVAIWAVAFIALGFGIYADAPLIGSTLAVRNLARFEAPKPTPLPAGLTLQ